MYGLVYRFGYITVQSPTICTTCCNDKKFHTHTHTRTHAHTHTHTHIYTHTHTHTHTHRVLKYFVWFSLHLSSLSSIEHGRSGL